MAVVELATGLERVRTAAAEGADIVEVAASGTAEEAGSVAAFVAAIRDSCPELVIGVRTGRREVARAARAAGADLLSVADADLITVAGTAQPSGPGVAGLGLAEEAAEAGAAVICPPDLAARVAEAGGEPERIVVDLPATGPVAEVAAAGWPVLVSLPGLDVAGSLATAAVAAWAGARVFRVRRVGETRRALRMVSAICGDIPPAYAVRGLALTGRPAHRLSVIRGFERAAQFGGAAPRLHQAALGLALHPVRPAQHEQPARRPHPLNSLHGAAALLGRELFYQIHADHSVVRHRAA